MLMRVTDHLSDTTRHLHALELAREIELKYDAVLTVSGDGLIHEVLNGFAQHAQPLRALSIPIAPIPTGSGNGLAHNLLGLKVYIRSSLCDYLLTPKHSGWS